MRLTRQTRTERACERCNKVFLPAPKTAGRYCSRVCFLGTENTPAARFWSHVDKNGPIPPRHPELGNCWDWTGATYIQGYGYLRIDGRQVKAHHFSLQLDGVDLGETPYVLHHCDRRICVRPTHLYQGDHAQNMEDIAEAGTRKGRQNNNAKLSETQALEIKLSGASTWGEYEQLGAAYGVHAVTVYEILRGRRWRHL